MRELLRRVMYALRWARRDSEIAEEMAFHREMAERDLQDRGVAPVDARAAARRALGNDLASRQYASDVWIAPWLQDLIQDIRFASRLLVRDRGFAATALVVLALGIGVNNMMFTLVNAHTLRGLPIERPDRVLYIATRDERNTDRGVSYLDFQDLRAAVRSFSGLGGFVNAPATLGDPGRAPDRFEGAYLSAHALELLGIAPVIGRSLQPDDDRSGAAPVVLLGSGAWRSRYGRDASILGRSVVVNGAPATVVGVLPEKSGFPSTAEVWLPLASMPGIANQKRDVRTIRVFGRLGDGIAATDASAEMESLANGLAREHPDTNRGIRTELTPINVRFFGQLTNPAWMAFTAAGFLIVLISCANVANLMLSRSIDRTREMAIRASLGATRQRIVRQLLIESAVLAAAGGAVGFGVSIAGVRLFQSALPDNVLPYWIHYAMDARGFMALAAVSVGTALVFGLVPALHASKTDVNHVLKSTGRLRASLRNRGARRWTTAFMAVELALTVVLLSYAVTDLTSRRRDIPSDSVINTPDVLTAVVTLPADKYRAVDARRDFYRRLDERLTAISGASPLSFATALPLGGGLEQQLEIDGRALSGAATPPTVWTVAIGPRYFETLKLSILRGRALSDRDGLPGQNHAVVNQRFADLHFPGEDPIGRVVRLTPRNAPAAAAAWTIVGIAPDVRQHPAPMPEAVAYTPFQAAPPATTMLLVRAAGDPGALTAFLREQLVTVDPDVPLYRTVTLKQAVEDAGWNGRVSLRLIYTLTFIAFAFSVVGLYAVTAHAVGQRTQEIVVRMALGARPGQVRRLVVMRAATQAAFGLVAGVACTILWDAVFFSGRVDVRFARPGIVLPICALLALVTLAACVVPVRRATRLDPATALRNE